MEHCITIGTFGLNRKHTLGKVRVGDKVACYVTKESKIIALGEAVSDYYIDDNKIFKEDSLFPDRFEFQVKSLPKDQEIDFRSMVDDLQFITNKFYWTVYLRSGIAKITQHDWNIIEAKTNLVKA